MSQDETKIETVSEEAIGNSKRRGRKPKPDDPPRESSTKSKYKKSATIVSVGAFEEEPIASSSASLPKRPLLFFKVLHLLS